MSAFDPAFTALDMPLLASYGVSVISENTVRFVACPSLLPRKPGLNRCPLSSTVDTRFQRTVRRRV